VLDGRTPPAKDKCLCLRNGREWVPGRASGVNQAFEAQKRMIVELMEAAVRSSACHACNARAAGRGSHNACVQGVPCVQAPGEGEAMCAALNAAGRADAVASTDVCDCFIFGATTVLRDLHLDFRKPDSSCLSYVRLEDIRRRFGLQARL